MAKRLTAKTVDNLAHGRYSDGGGTGLMLWVYETGTRLWVQRLRVNGKRHDIGLGGYPVVSLAEARQIALDNKRTAQRGGNPLNDKRDEQAAARKRTTFAEATRESHVELSPTWKNPKDRAAFLTTLEAYAWPYFGNVDVSDVQSAQVRKAVLACRAKRPGVAQKLTYRINAVFKWAMAENLCTVNPATRHALALPKMERKQKNNRALPCGQVAQAIDTVKASGAWASTKLAIEFTILTAARSGEVRGARWDEIDMNAAEWSIPAERMKMNRAHRVPLSGRALEALREAEQLRDVTGLVFPSVRGKQLSDMTLSKLVKELGINSTVHGFRSSFRTWAQERTSVPGEVAEAALAHVKTDKVEAAYARSDLFEKRRKLMESWAAFLSEKDTKVVRIGRH